VLTLIDLPQPTDYSATSQAAGLMSADQRSGAQVAVATHPFGMTRF
jgi:hypothetical protein